MPPLHLQDWKRSEEAAHFPSNGQSGRLRRAASRLICCRSSPSANSSLDDIPRFTKEVITQSVPHLIDYSLVKRLGLGALWMHDLTRQYFQTEFVRKDLSAWLLRAIEVLFHFFPLYDRTPEEGGMVNIFLSQSESIVAECKKHNTSIDKYAKLLVLCALCQFNRGHYSVAQRHYKEALPTFEKALGSKHPQVLTIKHRIGWTYRMQGDLNTAESYYRSTIEQRSAKLGKAHDATLNAMSDLAFTVERSGRLKIAEDLFKECCQREEDSHGLDHHRILCTKHNLALCYANQGRLSEAIKEYETILDHSMNSNRADDHDYLKTLSCFAVAMDHQGHLERAEELHKKALEGYKEKFGDGHLLTLRVRSNLSGVYRLQGRFAEAKLEIESAMVKYVETLGNDHFHVAIAHYDLGEVLHDQGGLDSAQKLFALAISILQSTGSPEHPLLLRVVNALGIVCLENGHIDRAYTNARDAFERNEKMLSFFDPYTLVAAHNYAEVLAATGKLNDASKLYQRVVNDLERLLDKDHPHVAMTKNSQALLKLRSSDPASLQEAGGMFKKIQASIESRLGNAHGCYCVAQLNLSRTLILQGQYTEAAKLINDTTTQLIDFFGDDHPMIGAVEYLLAVIDFVQQLFEAAEGHFQKALHLWAKSFTDSLQHPDVKRCAKLLERTYRLLHKDDAADDLRSRLQQAVGSNPNSAVRYDIELQLESYLSSSGNYDEWLIVLPIAYGASFRQRWGRKTCWREGAEPALNL